MYCVDVSEQPASEEMERIVYVLWRIVTADTRALTAGFGFSFSYFSLFLSLFLSRFGATKRAN